MATLARTSLLGLLFAACLHAPPANAAWVSNKGVDSNNCHQKTPCRTFDGAQRATHNGGIITCLDSGDFSDGSGLGFWITKSITIDCTGRVALVDGIFMRALPCPGCSVEGDLPFPDGHQYIAIIRGLTIYGGFFSGQAVHFTVGNALHIENCTLTGFASSSTFAAGINFAPTGESRLHVTNSVISGNGNISGNGANAGAGIIVKPTGEGEARVVLTRVQVLQNTFGIVADGTASRTGVEVTITDSVSGGNIQDGIFAISELRQAPVTMMVNRSRSVNNVGHGIRALGENVFVLVDSSMIAHNGVGMDFDSGAELRSAGNNVVERNRTGRGSFSSQFDLR
jgi:hypothetical protein